MGRFFIDLFVGLFRFFWQEFTKIISEMTDKRRVKIFVKDNVSFEYGNVSRRYIKEMGKSWRLADVIFRKFFFSRKLRYYNVTLFVIMITQCHEYGEYRNRII